MPDIYLDARLPDYFVEHDWRQVRDSDVGRDAVFHHFMAEKICILHGYDLSRLDFDFLGGVTLPQTWQMKKFNFSRLLEAVDAKGIKSGVMKLLKQSGLNIQSAELELLDFVRSHGFNNDDMQFLKFVEQLRHLKVIADDISSRLLAGIEVDHVNYVSRFCETRLENLHFDVDKNSDRHDSFRLYINLDKAPRIWNTSYQLTPLLEGGGQRLLSGVDESLPSESVLDHVSRAAFGGWHQRATERVAPRHLVFFDPGDIWLVDGRCVSHQVVTGHRVLSIYAHIPHADNPRLRPTFADKLRAAVVAARALPMGRETAQVNYFSGVDDAHAPDLKKDWTDIFGTTGTGRVRRFDQTGLIE